MTTMGLIKNISIASLSFSTITACAKPVQQPAQVPVKDQPNPYKSKVEKPVFKPDIYKKHETLLLYTAKSSGKSVLTIDFTCGLGQGIPAVGKCKFVNSAQGDVGAYFKPKEFQISVVGSTQPLELTYIGKGDMETDIKVIATVPIAACPTECPNIQFPGNYALATHALITSPGVAAKIGLQPGLEVAVDYPPE
jgi:hypothetical protein